MSPIELVASDFRQFGAPHGTFCLITGAADHGRTRCRPGDGYERVLSLTLPTGAALADLLAAEVPDGADVLVACPGQFLDSPAPEILGQRRLAVLPAGSTPLSEAQVDYFLAAAARTDVEQQDLTARRFFEQVSGSDRLTVVDDQTGSEAEFDHTAGDVVWNQQAGELSPGEQQLAPGGKLSVMPAEINTFAPGARLLGLTGTLTLSGWPIVHRHDVPGDGPDQQRLFDELACMVAHPVQLVVAAGVIETVRTDDDAARPAVEALTRLLEQDPRYRVIWELGFGINTAMDALPANCGPNEVHGGRSGVIHLGIGITPHTRFALAFLCPRSTLLAADGSAVLGRRKDTPRGRLNRVSSASCGCH
ncbi:hypothetical protein GA0115240_107717 [Streptomyces sp. DvalAA-14]|uniref:hypothetical protein n=1 Tax=unclassified Streptomyces TaxID=2593676 RepID=UPI00081B0762|nr:MULTISPECIES: hypothetical protein [unclassified Streptomyces]MYS19383.1 hypothetical protein [Streptomyces sp. SID4948]SCD43221.1 hypothetical protein GA0115240_107717 [Streptomyces sp. DvalAA-14]